MKGAERDATVESPAPVAIEPTVPDATRATGARAKRPPGQEAALEIGQKIAGRYRIERLLGTGGMGAVYRAFDEKLHRAVAVKVMRPELAAEAQLAARFEREAFASTRITSPHVVVVHDFGRDDRLLFLVMELLSGTSLGDKLAKGPLGPDEAVRVVIHVARALEHAHGAGIVHRDLKPDNIFLTDAGPAKVLDFGIARMLDGGPQGGAAPSLTVSGMIVGTPIYMSPEMARQQPVGPSADLYALGAIFYEMITGEPPFLGEETILLLAKHMTEDAPRLAAHPVAAGHEGVMLAALDEIIARLLDKDPTARGTATELRAKLEELVGSGAGWGIEKRPSGQPAARTTPRPDVDALGSTLPHVDSQATPVSVRPVSTRRGPALAVGMVVVASLAIAGAWGLSTGAGSRVPPAPSRVAAPPALVAESPPSSAPPVIAPPSTEVTIHFTLDPTSARLVSTDGTVDGTSVRFTRDEADHVVRIEAEGYEPQSVTVSGASDREVQVALTSARHGRPHASTAHPPATTGTSAPPPSSASGTGLQRQF